MLVMYWSCKDEGLFHGLLLLLLRHVNGGHLKQIVVYLGTKD